MYRLQGPYRDLRSIRSAAPKRRSGACEGAMTVDLLLEFSNLGAAWFSDPSVSSFQNQSFSPCEVQLNPSKGDVVELRLTYKLVEKAQKIEWIQYPNQDRWVIDFWFSSSSQLSPKQSTVQTGAQKKNSAKLSRKIEPEFKQFFENQQSWEKLLGQSVTANDNNGPGLNRFRLSEELEVNPGLTETPLAQRSLQIPIFHFPRLEKTIVFEEKSLTLNSYTVDDLMQAKSGGHEKADETERLQVGALKGLHFIVKLLKSKDWIRAKSAMDILERSDFRSLVPVKSPKYLAMKGLIFRNLGRELKDKAVEQRGLDIWRNALQTGISQRQYQTELDYMALELTRELFTQSRSYLSLGLLTWAEGFRWSPEVEQRFDYLRGEALYDLGFLEEAEAHFREYFQHHSKMTAQTLADRRLVPKAGFWIGDIEFQRGRFHEAVQEYTKSLAILGQQRQFSFEGKLFPNDVREYPQVLFNRAEAWLQLGMYKNALSDLRAFVYVAPNHPRIGLVYYKVSEVLQKLGAPDAQLQDSWRECVFRSPKLLGGRLCSAQKAVFEFPSIPKENWARSIGVIEDIQKVLVEDEKIALKGLKSRDLEAFSLLLIADAFLKVNEPSQALARLDASEKMEMDLGLRDWIDEYRMVSVAGRMLQQNNMAKYKEVIREYENRRKALFYRFVRPSVLWQLARAYQGLGLESEALKVLTTGQNIQKKIGEFAARPYDVQNADWVQLRVTLSLSLLAQNKLNADEVEAALSELKVKDIATERAWARYHQLTKNLKQEARIWERLAKNNSLNFEELYRYVQVLKELKAIKNYHEVLQTELGSWLKLAQLKFDEKAYPGPDLLMELVESYVSTKQPENALNLLNFLQSLDDKFLNESVTKPMIAYQKGNVQKSVGRFADARQSFGVAKSLAPTSIWGQLADRAEKELPATDSN